MAAKSSENLHDQVITAIRAKEREIRRKAREEVKQKLRQEKQEEREALRIGKMVIRFCRRKGLADPYGYVESHFLSMENE